MLLMLTCRRRIHKALVAVFALFAVTPAARSTAWAAFATPPFAWTTTKSGIASSPTGAYKSDPSAMTSTDCEPTADHSSRLSGCANNAPPSKDGSSTCPTPPLATTTRRGAIASSVLSAAAVAASALSAVPEAADAAAAVTLPNFLLPNDRRSDGGTYKQAKRATAYLVDSTIPPTLVPYRATREAAILKELGQGSGTSKSPFYQESINLNNLMQKGVYGTIKLFNDVISGGSADKKGGPGYGSFVFLGVDYDSAEDADLSVGLLTDICKPRQRGGASSTTALGLAFAPLSSQSALDSYLRDGDETAVVDALVGGGAGFVDGKTVTNYLPLLRFARAKNLSLLALSPEPEDIRAARTRGIQNVDLDRRGGYVVDSEGFINLTQDPKYKLYAEKSLLRDFVPNNDKDSPGDYFAERILVHEAIATTVATWAARRSDALVAVVAPVRDVRYMGGPNGRVPRIHKYLNPESKVDEDAVTTILLNPSAEETLSTSKFLRLEIGTAPATLQYQTKVADYLWFSKMPKVNMIPRMMNYP